MSTSCRSLLEMQSQVSLQTYWIRICILTRSSDDSCSFILKFEKHTQALRPEFFCDVISACRALAPTPAIPSAWCFFMVWSSSTSCLDFPLCIGSKKSEYSYCSAVLHMTNEPFEILSELSVLINGNIDSDKWSQERTTSVSLGLVVTLMFIEQ